MVSYHIVPYVPLQFNVIKSFQIHKNSQKLEKG